MQLPLSIQDHLSESLLENWATRFGNDDGYDRSIRENVWRRHQTIENRHVSGWKSEADARRRILHFRDKYGVCDGSFVLQEPFLFFHLKLPSTELAEYSARIHESLLAGSWCKVLKEHGEAMESHTRGDLTCTISTYATSKYDREEGVPCPPDYRYLDLTICRSGAEIPEEVTNRAWTALRTGIRPVRPSGIPQLLNPEDIAEFLPAQVELGCGPSIEADIPALNYLHRVYSITNKNKGFVLQAEDDRVFDFISDPERKYAEAADIHLACLEARPTEFYLALKHLHEAGHIVGKVLTNNFDGLPVSVGLDELPLRQFDAKYEYPLIEFHPKAKSLIVVGSHADRRNAQESARRQGLTIIYADPGGYSDGHSFEPYAVESPQDGDILVSCQATEFMARLAAKLNVNRVHSIA